MAPPSYYPPAPLPPAQYDWTGIYVGANIGGGLLSDAWTQSGPASGQLTGTALTGTIDVGPIEVVGGAQAGFNYQFKPVVIGIEASWSDSAITGNGVVNTTAANTQVRGTSAPLWFGTATGRVGYADNAWLFYAKGGGAWMNVKYTQDMLFGGFVAQTQSMSDNRVGYTFGAGIEFGMTENLSAIVEYDFFNFGTKNYNFTFLAPVGIRSELNTVTAGLNYRFNWAGWR